MIRGLPAPGEKWHFQPMHSISSVEGYNCSGNKFMAFVPSAAITAVQTKGDEYQTQRKNSKLVTWIYNRKVQIGYRGGTFETQIIEKK